MAMSGWGPSSRAGHSQFARQHVLRQRETIRIGSGFRWVFGSFEAKADGEVGTQFYMFAVAQRQCSGTLIDV